MATQPVTLLPATESLLSSGTVARDIGGLTFDAVISESHITEMEVTENPIETGVSIADHCFMKPLKVTVSAVVSDLKMPTASPLYDGSPSGRVRRAFELLQYLQTDLAGGYSEPFSITTGLQVYNNMVCTSLSATQDVTTASLLAFTAELTQVTILNTAVASYTEPVPRAGKTARQANWYINFSNQQPKQLTDEQLKSVAIHIEKGISTGVEEAVNWLKGKLGGKTTAPSPQTQMEINYYAGSGSPQFQRKTNLHRPTR